MKENKDVCYCKILYQLPDQVECMKERCARYRRERDKEKSNNSQKDR